MEKILIIAEKPSLAKTIAGALKVYTKQDGYYENDKYIVSFAFGHLFELYDVEKYLGVEKLAWKDTKLPFIPEKFKFNLKNDEGVKKQFGILKNLSKEKIRFALPVIARAWETESLKRRIQALIRAGYEKFEDILEKYELKVKEGEKIFLKCVGIEEALMLTKRDLELLKERLL